MAIYKTILKQNELQVIENISYNKKTQSILQSIYSYIVKHTNLNNGLFPKPLTALYKMYIRYHNKISCIYFRKLLKKLIDYKLVIVHKHRNINVYSVDRNVTYYSNNSIASDEVSSKVSQKVSSKKIATNVDITSVEDDSSNTQILNINNNIITIIDDTVSETVVGSEFRKSSAYEKACEENNKDLVKPSELIEVAINKLKEQGRHSKKIIARLKAKLENRTNVVRKNMDKYLDTVVADCIAFYEVERKNMALLIAKRRNKFSNSYNAKKNTTANFTQRKYDYDKLEKQLLGWDNSDDDCEIDTIEPTVTPAIANFTQREYDYIELEKQISPLAYLDNNLENEEKIEQNEIIEDMDENLSGIDRLRNLIKR